MIFSSEFINFFIIRPLYLLNDFENIDVTYWCQVDVTHQIANFLFGVDILS